MSESTAEPAVPDLLNSIIGFRSFAVERTLFDAPTGAEELHSDGVGAYTWKPGRNRAECRLREAIERGYFAAEVTNPGHRAPAPAAGCACGFYGLHDLAYVRADAGALPAAIACWGDIEVHSAGFRAEFAKVVAIGLPERLVLCSPRTREAVEDLARRYDAACVPLIDLTAAAYQHGIAVPDEMRPSYESSEMADFAAALQQISQALKPNRRGVPAGLLVGPAGVWFPRNPAKRRRERRIALGFLIANAFAVGVNGTLLASDPAADGWNVGAFLVGLIACIVFWRRWLDLRD